jgi:hypothetical protein
MIVVFKGYNDIEERDVIESTMKLKKEIIYYNFKLDSVGFFLF